MSPSTAISFFPEPWLVLNLVPSLATQSWRRATGSVSLRHYQVTQVWYTRTRYGSPLQIGLTESDCPSTTPLRLASVSECRTRYKQSLGAFSDVDMGEFSIFSGSAFNLGQRRLSRAPSYPHSRRRLCSARREGRCLFFEDESKQRRHAPPLPSSLGSGSATDSSNCHVTGWKNYHTESQTPTTGTYLCSLQDELKPLVSSTACCDLSLAPSCSYIRTISRCSRRTGKRKRKQMSFLWSPAMLLALLPHVSRAQEE